MGNSTTSYVMGVDLGTSSIKIILVDKNGNINLSVNSEYNIDSKQAGYSEQDPNDWINGFIDCLSKIYKSDKKILSNVECISVSGQMHSLVLLDENYCPIRKAILWNDTRTTEQCEYLKINFGAKLLEITKNIALEGFTLPKLLWVKKYEPDNFKKIFKLCLPKDYLIYRLTGVLQTEYSDAAGTLLFDVINKKWASELINSLNISEKILPDVNKSDHIVGLIKEEYCEEFDFKNNVKVLSGGADNALAALSSGLISNDYKVMSIGTSGVFLGVCDKDLINSGEFHFFNHVVDNLYYNMGVTLSAGYSLKWLKTNLFDNLISYDELLSEIRLIEPGSDNLFFTPWLFGERTPYIDSKVRGNFLGINSKTQKPHLIRAVIEGITFSLRIVKDLLDKNDNIQDYKIISTGGGSKNQIWLQIQADILNKKILSLENNDGPAMGAAIQCATKIGWFKSYKECCETFVKKGSITEPIPENVKKYNALYKRYIKIYDIIKPFYEV